MVNSAASLGLSFEEAETRRKKRAARFQSPLISCEKKSVETPEELLAKSQISFNNMSKFNKNRSRMLFDLFRYNTYIVSTSSS